MEFDNNNVDNSEYVTTSTYNNVVRYQVGNFFILHKKIRSFGRNFDEFQSFASELRRSAGVIVSSETWFSANTCRDVRGYTGFHTYRADRSGDGVSVFVRDCFRLTHVDNFSVCHAYYEFSVVRISFSNNCTVIIIVVYRPPDKSKISENWMKFCHQRFSLTMYLLLVILILTFQIQLPYKMILLTTATPTPSSLQSINLLAMQITIQVF